MTQALARLLTWDEINGECSVQEEVSLTRGDDKKLKRELLDIERKIVFGDCETEDTKEDFLSSEDGPWDEEEGIWEIVNITHGPSATIVEHRSDRNHLGISTIIWY